MATVEEPRQMRMIAGDEERQALLEPAQQSQPMQGLSTEVAERASVSAQSPPIWAGLLLAGLSVVVLLVCVATTETEVAAIGPDLRTGAGQHHRGAPLRMLTAAAGGGAIAGAWMAVGAFIGKCFGAVAGLASNLCHACGSLSTNICSAVDNFGAQCCGASGGALQSCPWCGNFLANLWYGIGGLVGGVYHAVVAFFGKMYGISADGLDGCCGACGNLGTGFCSSCGDCLARICPI